MANEKHLAILKQGVEILNKWVKENLISEADKMLIIKAFQENHLKALEAIEAKYRAELEAREELIALYREQNLRMRETIQSLANRPITINIEPASNSHQD